MAAIGTAHAADPPAAAPEQPAPTVAPAALAAQADAIQPAAVDSLSPAPEEVEPIEVEVFKGVEIRTSPSGNAYPLNEVRDGREGWVQLNMMIDPKGKPYEVMVMDSSGNPAFEKAALKVVNQMGFTPARRGDTPIDSSYMLKMKFAIKHLAKGASRDFVTSYRRLTTAITAGDKAAADAVLPKLNAQNLYEEAFEHYGRYFYFLKWGTPADQIKELRLAIAGEKRPEYLPKDAFTLALIAMFTLQAKDQDFGSALDTWKILEPLAPKEQRDALTKVAEEIKALQQSTRPLHLPGVIGENTTSSTKLFRNRFSIDVTSGAISEIKLRCEKQYLFFKYQPGLEYTIGRHKDQCDIEIIGDPGTKFVLAQ